MFEDTEMGIQAATAAGMASVRVPAPWERGVRRSGFRLSGYVVVVFTPGGASPAPTNALMIAEAERQDAGAIRPTFPFAF